MHTYQKTDLSKQNTCTIHEGELWKKGEDQWLKNTLNMYKMQNPDILK